MGRYLDHLNEFAITGVLLAYLRVLSKVASNFSCVLYRVMFSFHRMDLLSKTCATEVTYDVFDLTLHL